MQKILSIQAIRQADEITILQEPVASVDLMERAASKCFDWLKSRLDKDRCIKIFCGQGNNGGDGLAIGRMLADSSFNVELYLIIHSEHSSPDYQVNLQRSREQALIKEYIIDNEHDIPIIEPDCLLIDALFGSGLTKDVEGLPAKLVQAMNSSGAVIISIDVPSGLRGDEPSSGQIVKADYTLSFQVPKLAFFFPENDLYIGEWHVLPIGLSARFIEDVPSKDFLIDADDLRPLLKTRHKYEHKGSFGHGLLISGGFGKMGASILASRAALRSGAGLVTAHIPSLGNTIIQTAVPEAMTSNDPSPAHFSMVPALGKFNAIACGPGIGTHDETATALKLLIQNTTVPLILDADALNILSENQTWLGFLPSNSILTPHVKEFERITGKCTDSFERHEKQREFSKKYGVYVVLKGAYTCISFPNGDCYFNPVGNPGMATGGSGDVLTGILLGLMARGYTSSSSCLLGTYLHGYAGDIAAQRKGMESMIAGDIIDCLPGSFQSLTDQGTD